MLPRTLECEVLAGAHKKKKKSMASALRCSNKCEVEAWCTAIVLNSINQIFNRSNEEFNFETNSKRGWKWLSKTKLGLFTAFSFD